MNTTWGAACAVLCVGVEGAAWAGDAHITANPDQFEAELRAALDDATVTTIYLPPGQFEIRNGPLFIPYGQTLQGAGWGAGGTVVEGGEAGGVWAPPLLDVPWGAPSVTLRDVELRAAGNGLTHEGPGDLTLDHVKLLAAQDIPYDASIPIGDWDPNNPNDPVNWGGRAVFGWSGDHATLTFIDSHIQAGRTDRPNGDWDAIAFWGPSYDLVEVRNCTIEALGLAESPFNSADGIEYFPSDQRSTRIVVADSVIDATGSGIKLPAYYGSASITHNRIDAGNVGVAMASNNAHAGLLAWNHIHVRGEIGRSYTWDGENHWNTPWETQKVLRWVSAALVLGTAAPKYYSDPGNPWGGLGADVSGVQGLRAYGNTLSGTPEYGVFLGDTSPDFTSDTDPSPETGQTNYPRYLPDGSENPDYGWNTSVEDVFGSTDFSDLSPSMCDVAFGEKTNAIAVDGLGKELTVDDRGSGNVVYGAQRPCWGEAAKATRGRSRDR